ncbi:hypothetical protein [Paenibacillus sp. 1001270B_150601_E10]|nr:hypothetical protein [Paenibacillus sp. 1001270B_150601_E10]
MFTRLKLECYHHISIVAEGGSCKKSQYVSAYITIGGDADEVQFK